MKGKKKQKRILKNLGKRISILTLSALIIFSSVFTSYEMAVSASEDSSFWENVLIDLVASGVIAVGATAGTGIGNLIVPGAGGAVGAVAGASVAGTAVNAVLDWYQNPSETGTREHGGDGRTINYQYRKGVSTSQNTTNYDTTKQMSLYNETKTWNSTTNNYDYSYNWYNPITNNYDVTNEYTYNSTYNTYNYVTHNYDITNNYNYTTNYYIQDNRTYVSYYIINVCDETGEEEETYVEMYYELPDGRNSLYLTVDDIKGQYFPTNYSKYISVAEDDGTTLGLWHLDGDLKDSSYWGNTAGSSYNNVYTEGIYTKGKQFSDSKSDFIELKLDKVVLPSSWTLEWLEYIPTSEIIAEYTGSATTSIPEYSGSSGQYDDEAYDINYDLNVTGYLGVDGSESHMATAGYFIPYAVVCDNGSYSFYRNGVLVTESTETKFPVTVPYNYGNHSGNWTFTKTDTEQSFHGINVTDNSVKFYAPSEPYLVSRNSTSYVVGYQYTSSSGSTYKYYSHPVWNYYQFPHKNAIVDEVRLSSGVLYSGDSYTPSSQAFTTNTVLAVPENPEKHEIAFKTNTDISDVRFGGARPTYPTNGYVYVALDADDKVESIQQYQEDGWYEIEASLYTGNDWVSFKEVNMEYLGIDGVEDDSGGTGGDSGDTGDDSGDTGGGSGGDSDDSSGGGVQAVLDGIGKFFDTLLNLVGKIIGLFSGFVDSVLSLFEGFTVFTDGFSGFLSSSFGFLPPEAINVLISGITLIVILAIIKFLK